MKSINTTSLKSDIHYSEWDDIGNYIRKSILQSNDLDYCYKMGYDCELNGANEINCHFSIFSTEEKMHEWEHGKIDARKKMNLMK